MVNEENEQCVNSDGSRLSLREGFPSRLENSKSILFSKDSDFIMRYQQKDFTNGLKARIQETESALKEHCETLLKENKSIFENKNLELDAGFDIDGYDHFQTGYCSTITIGISDKTVPNGELIDLHQIKIWECQRTILGMSISKNIPGSKVVGDFLDESLEEIQEELKEYIEDFLSEEI